MSPRWGSACFSDFSHVFRRGLNNSAPLALGSGQAFLVTCRAYGAPTTTVPKIPALTDWANFFSRLRRWELSTQLKIEGGIPPVFEPVLIRKLMSPRWGSAC